MGSASPSLGRATVVSAMVDAALAVVSIASVRILVHALGTEPYGVLGLVTVLGTQLSTLHLGVGPSLLRLLGEARGRADAPFLRATLRAGGLLALASALAVAALALAIAPRAWSDAFAASAPVREQALVAVPATAFVLGMQPVLAMAFASLAGLERFTLLSGIRLAHGVLRIAAAVVVAGQGGSLAAVLLAQGAADVVMAAAAGAATRSLPAADGALPLRAAAARILALGVPLSLAGIAAGLLMDGDKIAIGTLRSVAEVAFYTVPANVVGRLAAFAGMACVFLVPRLAAATAAGQDAEATRLASRATRLGLCLTVTTAAPLIALAPELLGLWLGPSFVDHSTLAARILLVGVVVNVSAYGPHSVIRARGHAAALPVMYALELPLFALLLWLLVPRWGAVGAAAAWSVRVAVDALTQHLLARSSLGRTIVPLALPGVVALVLGGFALACHLAGGAALLPRAAGGAVLGAVALALLTAEDRDSLRRALWLSPSRGAA